MRIIVKALRSKPDVSLNVAVGSLELKADDILDSALLTAMYRAMQGQDVDLSDAITEGAKRVAKSWEDLPEFVMQAPIRRKQAKGGRK